MGEVIVADGCEVPAHASVTKDFKHGYQNRLGPAFLTKHPDRIVAEWEWPGGDKLPCIALYPAVSGVILEADKVGETRYIRKCKIREIGLSPAPNQDSEILSIQEQNPSVPIHWEKGVTRLIKKALGADESVEHVDSQSHASPPPPVGSD
jgi:hypothetical protein